MYEDRILARELMEKVMTADEAAALIGPASKVGFSGFTEIGYPKEVPMAMARQGKARDLTAFIGAAPGDELDGELVRAGLLKRRYAYQSHRDLRAAINRGDVAYVDMHLSLLPHWLRNGIFGRLDFAVVEGCMITENGGIVPGLSVGIADSAVGCADKVIVEINTALPTALYGMHDIYSTGKLPIQKAVPIFHPGDRIGTPYIPCDPDRIAAIVITDREDQFPHYTPADAVSDAIARNILGVLEAEVAAGRLPPNLLPLQSGVGTVANAVLKGLGEGGFDNLTMYTEVMQDNAFELVLRGKITAATATAISLSAAGRKQLWDNLDLVKERVVIRPQDISNHPEVIRRLGNLSMNTAIEVDLYGNVNSTHIMGSSMMNGIGGSGDFTRNAGTSFFLTPSTAKDGAISCIVPMVSHVDHTEHDTQIIVTEQGVADLRGKSPREKAELLIERCAHPDYRPLLREYFEAALASSKGKHTPVLFDQAHAWHTHFLQHGRMRP